MSVDAEGTAGSAPKRARAAVPNVSQEYARALAAAQPQLSTTSASEVQRFLASQLPNPVLVDESHAALLASASGAFPVTVRPPEKAMPDLEALLEFSHGYCVSSGGTEEMWASLADVLTGNAVQRLCALAAVPYTDNRNSADTSGATQGRLRPDYCAWINGALVLKAEHRRSTEQLAGAMDALRDKTVSWNPLVMRGMPFLPCYAVGGHLIQFALLLPGPGPSVRIEAVTEVLSMASPSDRLRVLATSFNLFRLIVWLRARMPLTVPKLYARQPRRDGGSITVYEDHVVKRCRVTAPADVYKRLQAGAIPCAVRVTEHALGTRDGALARLVIRPVALEMRPHDEAGLRTAVVCVLTALAALHAAGFVHRDVRWPNVLHAGGAQWLLADFELASRVGEPLLPGAIDPRFVAPEAQPPGAPYGPAADVWQVGRLIGDADVAALSAGALAFAARLEAPERPSATEALLDPWLAAQGS